MSAGISEPTDQIVHHLWLKSYLPDVPAEIDIASLSTLADVMHRSFVQFGSKPACVSFGKTLTYAQLQREAEALLSSLQARGFKKGDRIGLMMPNVMAYPVCLAALILGGYVIVSANPLYTTRELQHQMKDGEVRAIIVLETFAHVLEGALPGIKPDLVIIATPGDFLGLKGKIINFVAKNVKKAVPAYSIPNAVSLASLVSEGRGKSPALVSISLDDIAFLQYTGGTTGVSKGAVLTHRNISANLEQNYAWLNKPLAESPHKNEHVFIAALPLYHIYALTCCAMFSMRIGASMVLIANPRDIPAFIKILKTSKFTVLSGVNTLFNALLNAPGFDDIDFSHVAFFSAGGMALQGPVAQRWKAATGMPILEGYGLSETSPVLTANRPDITDFTGTIGFPLPSTELIILREDGTQAAVGEAGEICAKGPQVMKGYWKRDDETAKVMTPDGFFKTGDIGIMQEDGKFKIVDRIKDMILVSGFNVYPNEVEDVIAGVPGVLEVAVVGMPDATSTEAVAAYVVVKDPSVTEAIIKEYCHQNLARYKCPKKIFFKDTLPKTNVGKVLRRVLRDEAAAVKKG